MVERTRVKVMLYVYSLFCYALKPEVGVRKESRVDL